MNRVLIVEDDRGVASAIAREVEPAMEPVSFNSIVEAAGMVRDESLDDVVGAIVDVHLPDGDGLDLVASLRQRRRSMAILVLTGSNEPATINRAHALGAEYVCKPYFRDNLRAFLTRLSPRPQPGEDLSGAVDRVAERFSLSARERQILELAVSGVPRSRIAEVLKVSENTVKSQIRSLLQKTTCDTVSDLVWMTRSEP